MKILVIGGQGLIGTAIAHHLAHGNHVLTYDIKTPNEEWELKESYDAVIDCAMYKKPSEQRDTWDTVIDHFKQQQGGRMILFSSIYGHKAPDFSIYEGMEIAPVPIEYAIWKGGIEQATRYLAQRLKPYNIQVNAIAPGGVCDNHSQQFQDAYALSGEATMIRTKNILPVVDMLLHPDNAVNGQVITVDGGWCL
jgi:NAD(P)-dependent dehydrogenase (short-subunit alcohol dehydrogenase family)